MKSRAPTLKLYILREYAFSFFIAFLFFFFIFFVNQILVVARSVLLKNVTFTDMLLILVYSVPIILAYTFPFSSLTGATMALGDLSSRNEILAMRTSGISYRQILAPVLLFSIVLTGLSFVLNDVFLPLGTIKYKQLYRELLYENPGLDLEPYAISRFNELIFITGDTDGNQINDLLIIDTSDADTQVLISDYGELNASEQGQQLELNLYNMEGIEITGSALDDYVFFSSKSMQYFLKIQDISFNLLSVAPNEKSLRDLYADIEEKRRDMKKENLQLLDQIEQQRHSLVSDYYADSFSYQDRNLEQSLSTLEQNRETTVFSRTLQYYLLEFYKKTALPFACLFLVFFAFPFSLIHMKNGRLVGFSLGMVTSVLYWFMLFAGQTVGARSGMPPFLLMWAPNLLLFGFGLIFLLARIRR
jgi:lipopolysaccharide export system permease protein